MGRRGPRPPLALATVLTLLLIPVACGSNDTQQARDLVRKALRKDVRSADVSLRSQLRPGQRLRKVSDEQIDGVEDAVEDPPFELSIGRRDGILRRFETNVRFELSDEQRRDALGLKGGLVSFVFKQTGVNGNQRIRPPRGARPLSQLLRRLGIPPGLLGGSRAQIE
jgi:hypothetical protein